MRTEKSMDCAARNSFGGDSNGAAEKGDGKTVFIKGFDTSWPEDDLKEGLNAAFAEYGEVEDIRLPYDRENDCRKGFGYVVFAEATGANVRLLLRFCTTSNPLPLSLHLVSFPSSSDLKLEALFARSFYTQQDCLCADEEYHPQ